MIEGSALPVYCLSALVFGPLLGAVAAWFLRRPVIRHVLGVALAMLLTAGLVPVTAAAVDADGLRIAVGGHAAPGGIEWVVDGLTLAMLWLVQLVALAVNAYLVGWSRDARPRAARLLQVTWLLLWGGLNGLFLSDDLFNMYVTLEVASLAGVALVAASGGAAFRAAMRYLLFALSGSMFFLLGVALAYADTGTLGLRTLAEAGGPGAAAAFALTAGLLVKAALFPVHAWLPSAHAQAPAPASAVLSALVVPAAGMLLLRLWAGPLAGSGSEALYQGLALLGAAGLVHASLMALVEGRLKRIIAYSTVAQLAYLLMLPAIGSLLAWQGIAYHVVAHGFAKAGMFLAAGNITRTIRDDRLPNLAGMDRVLSGNLMIVAVCGVSLAGLPLSGGFIGKWWLVVAALEQGQWWWAAVLAGGGLATAAYVFRVLAAGLKRPDNQATLPLHRAADLPASMLWPPCLMAFIALVLGLAGSELAPLLVVGEPWRSGQ